MKITIKIENLQQNVALITSYQSMYLTQNLGLTTYYQYMNEVMFNKISDWKTEKPIFRK